MHDYLSISVLQQAKLRLAAQERMAGEPLWQATPGPSWFLTLLIRFADSLIAVGMRLRDAACAAAVRRQPVPCDQNTSSVSLMQGVMHESNAS